MEWGAKNGRGERQIMEGRGTHGRRGEGRQGGNHGKAKG